MAITTFPIPTKELTFSAPISGTGKPLDPATIADGAIAGAKLANDGVTLEKQASGTANRLQGFDASGNPSEIAVVGATLSAGTLTVPTAADAKFRGTVADATALAAISSPLNGDVAMVTNTNTVSGGASGVPGLAFHNGTSWAVFRLFPTMTAATTAATGTKGEVPIAPIDSQNKFLRGDATFGTAIPAWATGINYEVGDVIYDGGTNIIYRCITAHLSSGSIVTGNFTELSPSSGGGGGGSSWYDAGNGAYVRASGTGITFVRTSSSVWTCAVPDGVEIESIEINSTSGESATAALDVKFVFAGSRPYNQNTDLSDLHAPAKPSTLKRTSPAQYESASAGNNPSWTLAVTVAGTLVVSTSEFTEVGGGGAQGTFIKMVF